MNPEQNSPQIQSDETRPEPSSNRITNARFWRSHRRLVIISLIILALAVIAAFFVWHARSGTAGNAANTNSQVKDKSKPAASSVNTWSAAVDPKALPLGDGKVSTSPQVGYIDSCTTSFRGGGARHAGDWINESAGTWNSETKVSVTGSVDWPTASFSNTLPGNDRILTTNDLPLKDLTGTFPIARSDPAYQFDTNPNHIAAQTITLTLPANPAAAATPNCVSLGYIGVLTNGVLLFNALDDAGRDAVAHETQDTCDGHPDGRERYHYHNIASCIRSRSTGSSTLVGYAIDGYGIYVERDRKGNLPTNADLDVCHGRTSQVEWNGKQTTIYHYDATLEYPYTIGCFHGTPVTNRPGAL
jgi:hypothetical protein